MERKEFVVYLSSTLADLGPERDAALAAISEFGVVRQSFRASESGLPEACTADVRNCHLYVGILGKRYGHVPGGNADPAAKSITELEYEACASVSPPIPRLMYLKSGAAGIEDAHNDFESNPLTRDRMKAFLERAGTDQTPFVFKSLHELKGRIAIDVSRNEVSFRNREYTAGRSSGSEPLLKGSPMSKNLLSAVALACVPGTDDLALGRLRRANPRMFHAFELSPDARDHFAICDRGFRQGHLNAWLLTSASVTRLITPEALSKMSTSISLMRARGVKAILVCCGVGAAQVPSAWLDAGAQVLEIAADTFTAPGEQGLELMFQQLRAMVPQISAEARQVALPLLVLAPTLNEVRQLVDSAPNGIEGHDDEELTLSLTRQFERVQQAIVHRNTKWPQSVYADGREQWRCFGPQGPTVEELVQEVVDRINSAGTGSRERRFLVGAEIVVKRVQLDEFLVKAWGSQQALLQLRDQGMLVVVDEMALLHPALRKAADQLLGGQSQAVLSVMPCDPALSTTHEILNSSTLRVGNLVSRFRNEHDPRCEVSLSHIDRAQRWLRFIIPELVASFGQDTADSSVVAQVRQSLVSSITTP